MKRIEQRLRSYRVDDSISYCPHCGQRLLRVSVVGKTVCERCGRAFLCIAERDGEGAAEEEEA